MARTFSYILVDSDESRAIYAKMLTEDAGRMLAWRSAKEQREYLPLEGAFSAWWFAYGPTSFATGSDAVRYRRELLEKVKAVAAVTL